jgi:hypothetical protein
MAQRFRLRDCSGTWGGRCITLLRLANRDTILDLCAGPDGQLWHACRGCGGQAEQVNGSRDLPRNLENSSGRVPALERGMQVAPDQAAGVAVTGRAAAPYPAMWLATASIWLPTG